VSSGHTISGENASAASSGSNWGLRFLFGILLACIVIALVALGPEYFAVLLVLAAMLAAREWHRLVRTIEPASLPFHKNPFHLQTLATTVTVALVAAAMVNYVAWLAGVFLVLGTVAGYVLAQMRGDNAPWQAAGVLYIGIPVLSLLALHVYPMDHAPHPQLVVGFFLLIWATDTGALLFGKLIGGPKLAPAISPGKTWAGTIGGSVCAALIYGLYIWFYGFSAVSAMLFAFVFSAIAHGGDLFESFVKRRFGRKDSGRIIPGHGGVLDRVDSTFAAAPVMALLVFVAGLNPLFGGFR
jgi:phosphatidate cytidylyltransferase